VRQVLEGGGPVEGCVGGGPVWLAPVGDGPWGFGEVSGTGLGTAVVGEG
jgi:hypothetical protein